MRIQHQLNLIIARQGAAGHYFPDRNIRIGWKNFFRLVGHFIFNEMGLMFDTFTTHRIEGVNEIKRIFERCGVTP